MSVYIHSVYKLPMFFIFIYSEFSTSKFETIKYLVIREKWLKKMLTFFFKWEEGECITHEESLNTLMTYTFHAFIINIFRVIKNFTTITFSDFYSNFLIDFLHFYQKITSLKYQLNAIWYQKIVLHVVFGALLFIDFLGTDI